MLIGGIALGLLLGLLLGGRLENLANIRLRFLPLLFIAVIVRFGTEAALGFGIPIAETLRIPLLGLAYGLLLFTLWKNRFYPGLALAFIGIASNGLVIMVNGGYMPVWIPAFEASGLPGPLDSVLHVELTAEIGPEFLLSLGPLADIIPIPFPPVQNVASIGDIFLSAGLGFFLFATLLRTPDETERAVDSARTSHYEGFAGTLRLPGSGMAVDEDAIAIRSGTGLTAALDDTIALERPLMMGAGGMGLASPALAPLPPEEIESRARVAATRGLHAAAAYRERRLATDVGGIVLEYERPSFLERLRAHPYVRLALNPSFSALWVGQLISLFGDRVNQIALAAFVFEVTKSPLALALTFFAATVPNLFLSPIAGTFVDRWDQKQVLVVSDILRAAAVLLVPVAILFNVWLAYPVVFLITTISIFFRPARQAVLPRIVPEEDLLPANSAMWVGETLADVINYPIAGIFVIFLKSSLALAFWFDAVTYLASAALLATIVVPPIARRAMASGAKASDGADGAADAEAGASEPGASVTADLKVGWAFLRRETVLLANTLQGTAGQISLGVITVGSLVLAQQITPGPEEVYRGTYAFMEAAMGLGGLVGGFALGAIAGRAPKGKMIIAAYVIFGALTVAFGLAGSVPMALGLAFGLGVTNMAFVIPSQTLFQERTPPELMGRVVSFRFALVFGGMSLAMALGGVAIALVGPSLVIAGAGLISMGAGLAGLFVRAVREA
ncbi:MAG TPA: MFS transporter [Candidatus Limnocylindrales bacterium]|nr:MFS transporter [Candidatus Limnocylindrales bacterium]